MLRTREPGGTPAAEAIRALLVTGAVDRWDPISEAMLHIAARRDHVSRVIEPALSAETWVLCDRFTDSTRAYQGYGHGLGIDLIDELHAAAVPNVAPDLTLILDVPVSVGLDRAVRRAADAAEQEARYEKMDHGFHERLRAGFLEIADREPERCVVIDAAQEPDAVFAAVREAVAARFAGVS